MSDDSKLPLKARVRLRDGLDSTLYAGMAKVGNEGWITDRRSDRFGLSEVFIHWDPFHWAYNYQPDCWTFEEHFDRVDPMADNDIRKQISDMAASFAQLAESLNDAPDASASESQAPQEAVVEIGVSDEEYAASSQRAIKLLSESDAFVLVTVEHQDHPMAPKGLLKPQVVGDTKSHDAQLLVGMQLAQLAAGYHHDAALALMETTGDDGPTAVTG